MQTFKKLDDNKFKRIDVNESITILDKDALEKSKKFLEEEIKKLQVQLAWINRNLDGIKKAK